MTDRAPFVFPPGQGKLPTNAFEPFRLLDLEQSIPGRFALQVRRYPNKVAVETAAGTLTYSELNKAANQVAASILQRRGPKPEPVAMLVSHGAPQIVAILGILKAGKIYVPLDPSFPVARNQAVVNDARPALIVTDGELHALARRVAPSCPSLIWNSSGAKPVTDDPRVKIPPEQRAVIIYTSGSTGKPHGLVHSHRNLMHFAFKHTNNAHISHDDRVLMLYSCAFIGSVADMLPALLNGATLLPYDLKTQGIANLAVWMAEKQITRYQSVPTLFRRFVATLDGTQNFAPLRSIRLGGESTTPRDVELHRKHFPPTCLLSVSLAATEILGISLYYVDRDAPLEGPRVPVGYAQQDTEVLLVDESGAPVPQGQPGEMVVCSPYLAHGYWGDPVRTKAAFPPDPERPGWRRYRLGDLGVMQPDGRLEHLGRKDWQVKIRGHRVEISEVEAALLAIPRVKEVVVIGVPTATGGQRLVAYVVPENETDHSVSTLRAALQEQLPEYLIPSAFVLLQALSTTPTGKVNRRALPPPTTARPELNNVFVGPRDPLQLAVCEIWKDCLNVASVGIHDDFFELGGDSALAIDMTLRVEELFGRALRQEELLASRTVEKLTQALMQPEAQANCPPLTEIQAGAAGPPLFFFHGDFNGGGLYSIPLARHLSETTSLIAIHPHGVSGSVVPATIEEMARDRLREIRKWQPSGPYRLGGHCNGAFVAFEIAQQLLCEGQQVEFLAMLAPPPGSQPNSRSEASNTSGEPIQSSDISGLPAAERTERLNQAYHDACSRYVMQHYAARMLVVLPKNDLRRYEPHSDWMSAAASVELLGVPGAHVSMLAPQYLPTVAEAMKRHLLATPEAQLAAV